MKDYFSNISRKIFECKHVQAEAFCESNDFNIPNESFPELYRPFTVNEIVSAVKSLKRTKRNYGSDCVLDEYLIKSIDILSAHLCDLFNSILNAVFFLTIGLKV